MLDDYIYGTVERISPGSSSCSGQCKKKKNLC